MNTNEVIVRDIEEVYQIYADMLYRVAYSYVQSSHDASDIVSDVFVRYMQLTPVFEDEDHCKAWLLKVTINKCKDLLRKNKIRKYIPIMDYHHIDDKIPRQSEVLEILDQLPSNYRSVLTLHYLEGFLVKEIAVMEGCSESSIKMRLTRGREMMKKELERSTKNV